MALTPNNDVIAAVATGTGRAGVGIVRVSGKNLGSVAAGILGRIPNARRAVRASFRDKTGRPIDDGIAIYYPAPASYTGEDVLELQGHGGPVVLQMVLRRCQELGARLAEPGEFTRRGFLNGKLDLAQAEGVADLIEAATEAAARCALRSLRGEFSEEVREFGRALKELRALVEATLDFADEEIDAVDRQDAEARLHRLQGQVASCLERGQRGGLLRSGLQVVLAGQPNVGKSSLLNRLAGEDVAIVTEVPGTTRDTVRQLVQIEGVPINVIDTAGLRDTTDAVERIGIARAWEAIEDADVLLLVVDARVGIGEADHAIVSRLPAGLERVVVFNKIDLLGSDGNPAEGNFGRCVHLSAKTGQAIDTLREVLLEIAGWRPGTEDAFMARERHLVALQGVGESLTRAALALPQSELFAEELRLAQQDLNSITGEFGADDLLGEIFSRFCIGK